MTARTNSTIYQTACEQLAEQASTMRMTETEDQGVPWAAHDAAGFWFPTDTLDAVQNARVVARQRQDDDTDDELCWLSPKQFYSSPAKLGALACDYHDSASDDGYDSDSSHYSSESEGDVDWVRVGDDEFIRRVWPRRQLSNTVENKDGEMVKRTFLRSRSFERNVLPSNEQGGQKRKRVADDVGDNSHGRKKRLVDDVLLEPAEVAVQEVDNDMKHFAAWEWYRWNKMWDEVFEHKPPVFEDEQVYSDRVWWEQHAAGAWNYTDRANVNDYTYHFLEETAYYDSPHDHIFPGHPRGISSRPVYEASPLRRLEVDENSQSKRYSSLLCRRKEKYFSRMCAAEVQWKDAFQQWRCNTGGFGSRGDWAYLNDEVVNRLAFPYGRKPQRNADGSEGANLTWPLQHLEVQGYGQDLGPQQCCSEVFIRRWNRLVIQEFEWSPEILLACLKGACGPIRGHEVAVLQEIYGDCRRWADLYGIGEDLLDIHVPWWKQAPSPGEGEGVCTPSDLASLTTEDLDGSETDVSQSDDWEKLSMRGLPQHLPSTRCNFHPAGRGFDDKSVKAKDEQDDKRILIGVPNITASIACVDHGLEDVGQQIRRIEAELEADVDARYCADVILNQLQVQIVEKATRMPL